MSKPDSARQAVAFTMYFWPSGKAQVVTGAGGTRKAAAPARSNNLHMAGLQPVLPREPCELDSSNCQNLVRRIARTTESSKLGRTLPKMYSTFQFILVI